MSILRLLLHCAENLSTHKKSAIAVVAAILVFTLVFGLTLSYQAGVEKQISEHYKAIMHLNEGSIQYNFFGVNPQDSLTHAQRAKDLLALRKAFSGQALFAGMRWHTFVEHFGHSGPTRISLLGAEPEYFAIRGYRLISGRALDERDEHLLAKDCVITSKLAGRLFHGTNAVGSIVTIEGVSFIIRGVRACEAERPFYSREWGPNDEVLIPYATAGRLFGITDGPVMIRFSVGAGAPIKTLRTEIVRQLASMHPSKKGKALFRVNTFGTVTARHRERMRGLFLYGIIVSSLCLVVCMSIITSLLLQMLSQQKIEIAMKRAMGGTIRRIYMELTVESLLMVLLGSALSLGVIALFPVIIHSLPVSVYRKYPLAISYSTLFAVVGTSVGMAVVCELPCLVALKRLSVAELLR